MSSIMTTPPSSSLLLKKSEILVLRVAPKQATHWEHPSKQDINSAEGSAVSSLNNTALLLEDEDDDDEVDVDGDDGANKNSPGMISMAGLDKNSWGKFFTLVGLTRHLTGMFCFTNCFTVCCPRRPVAPKTATLFRDEDDDDDDGDDMAVTTTPMVVWIVVGVVVDGGSIVIATATTTAKMIAAITRQ